jgi:hypothetical protein
LTGGKHDNVTPPLPTPRDDGSFAPLLLRHNGPMRLTRITIDPASCTGKPCIRGLRFPVARLLGLLAAGETREQILNAYP